MRLIMDCVPPLKEIEEDGGDGRDVRAPSGKFPLLNEKGGAYVTCQVSLLTGAAPPLLLLLLILLSSSVVRRTIMT